MDVLDLPQTIDHGTMHAIIGAYHGDPFAVLGMHQVGDRLTVRVFRPDALDVTVREVGNSQREFPAKRLHHDGFFEAVLPADVTQRFDYELKMRAHDGHEWTQRDPYSFGQILGPMDIHLFAE